MTENQRLKILMKQLGFATQKDFAAKLNVKQGSLSDIFREKPGVGVSSSILDKLEFLFQINRDWLKTGEGEMFRDDLPFIIYPKSENRLNPPRLEAKPISLADPDGEFRTGERIYELPDGQKIMEVKIVPAKGQAGYLRGFPDPEYYDDLPTLTIQVNGNHRGSYLAFEVNGDSMTPARVEDMADAILEGWYVIGRELPRHHWEYKLHTHAHSYWVIVHKTEGILIKQIVNHNVEAGTITVHSLNPKYADEDLDLKDIEQIFSGIKRVVNDR